MRKNIGLTFLLLTIISYAALSQEEPSEKSYHFNGSVGITNDGFSFIPSFSLGKPATIVDLSVGGNRFSFDPQFRFDLEGLKPWSFIFIWRYKVVQTDRFEMKVGLHLPAISFKEQTIQINGVDREQIVSYRFLTPELMPTYKLSRNINIGMYYIWGIGLEKEGQTRNTHFLSLRAFFNQICLIEQFYLNWNPQIYYLNLDGTDGIYTAQSLTLAHKKLPVSISSMMNFKLKSDVPTKDFDWNISLVYSFKNQFAKNIK